MTMLASYDRARVALAEATRVDQVLSIRDELEHVKLYARQIQDKALLEDAIVFQTRTERRLGILLAAAKEGGQIAEGRRPKDEISGRVTLKEIGVDKKLSSRAQKAAALDDDAFEDLIENTRVKVRSGGAIMVDPINAAAKDAEIAGRRAAHAERTLNGGCVADLGAMARSGRKFASIGMDPQWKFLTRSAAGEGRSANIHYKTEEVDKIKELPVGELAADDCALYMWMVDWCPQDALDLIAHYGFKHVTTAFTWVKTNGDDPDLKVWDKSTFAMGQGYWSRANPEDCWLATRGNPKRLYADVRQLIVAPLMEHSRKPDEWLDGIERLTEGDYLELQARRPRKGWTSWGDELKFTGVAA
jgi:N6-adenosine-specific RNA methylase IME4